jgi:predicted CoA-binding protein
MREGRVLFDGAWPPPQSERPWIHFTADRQEAVAQALMQARLVSHVTADGRAQLNDGIDSATVNKWLMEQGFRVSAINPHRPSLEEFYMQLAGAQPKADA